MASEVDPLSRALSPRFRQRPALGPGGAVAAEDPGISAPSTPGTSGIAASSRRGSRSRYSASPRAAGQTPRPIAIEPAAISARPAATTRVALAVVPDTPAAGAKGTVGLSGVPI